MRRIIVAASLPVMAGALAFNPCLAAADPGLSPAASQHAINIVVQRALSQRGVPYTYGGGNVTGPTRGVDEASSALASPTRGAGPGAGTTGPVSRVPGTSGPGTTGPGTAGPGLGADPSANAVGFDASGLVQYAYAGAGLKMPRTSGQQCNVGRKVLPAQAQPGDLICFGPAGSEGVAIYIGNGQMVEATPPAVMVTTARSDGMNPYLTRIIG